MRTKRFIVTSLCASAAVLGLICLVAMVDDSSSPNPPPRALQVVLTVAAWPFAITSALLHGDPPPGLCWWLLLAATGLFWGGTCETLFVVKNARRPNKRASGKGGIPSLLTIGRARPALPEHERSATHDAL